MPDGNVITKTRRVRLLGTKAEIIKQRHPTESGKEPYPREKLRTPWNPNPLPKLRSRYEMPDFLDDKTDRRILIAVLFAKGITTEQIVETTGFPPNLVVEVEKTLAKGKVYE